MAIISAEAIDKKIYRCTMTLGHGIIENIIISDDGLYSLYYIKEGKSINRTGKILNIVQNNSIPQNSYILFDWSEDNSNKRERIHFYQIQFIKDVTPNNAYKIALDHGFVGSVEDWLESLKGLPGKDNYQIAVDCGFEGTREEWLESIRGARGYSAYELATANGYKGTEKEWLASLKGERGLNAYELAVANGFKGTEAEWILSLKGKNGDSAYELAVKAGFEGSQSEWLESLRGHSAYEIAVSNGYEGTEKEWLESIGDTTTIRQDVGVIESQIEQIIVSMSWTEGM